MVVDAYAEWGVAAVDVDREPPNLNQVAVAVGFRESGIDPESDENVR